MSKQEALSILGLTMSATDKDIKKAFRNLAKKYHPDVVGEEGKDKFITIQKAYDSLTNGTFSAPAIVVTHSSIFKVVRTA